MPRYFALLLLACCLSLPTPTPAIAAEAPSNIVIIMADDLGTGDVGQLHREYTGRDPLVETPHMDALIREGMFFTDGHSSTSLCSPSRYCIMTGNFNYRSYAPWGVWGTFRESPITDRDTTLGRIGKAGGLTTGFIGKWHLGGDFYHKGSKKIYRGTDRGDKPLDVDASTIIAGGPQDMGFDYSYMLPCGIQGPVYIAYENGAWSPFDKDSELVHFNEDSAKDPAFVSDKGPGPGDSHWNTRAIGPILADKAEAFIRDAAGKDQRFLLYYCSPQVHIPHMPPAEFDDRKVKGATPTPHLDMVIDFDQQVGRIVKTLKEAGVYEDTLFVLTSDNGSLRDGKAEKLGYDGSGPYRGSKNHAHEGGHLIPFFAVWPGHVEPGSRSDEFVAIHDLAATVARLLGVSLNEKQAMDSLDFSPLLLGQPGYEPRHESMLQSGSQNEIMFYQGDWKLIIDSNHKLTEREPVALFNLKDNPYEKESGNLVNDPAHAERVKALSDRYWEIRDSERRTTPPLD